VRTGVPDGNPTRIGPGSQISSDGFARRCSNWNPIEKSGKPQIAANLCVFTHLQQASQASDVGFDSHRPLAPGMTCYIAATMPKHKVGDRVLVKLSGGRIVEATIKALVDTTEGTRLQVDFGYDETALVYEWQVVVEEGD
jgi:hypothetical protein